jgi:hypothetical protein
VVTLYFAFTLLLLILLKGAVVVLHLRLARRYTQGERWQTALVRLTGVTIVSSLLWFGTALLGPLAFFNYQPVRLVDDLYAESLQRSWLVQPFNILVVFIGLFLIGLVPLAFRGREESANSDRNPGRLGRPALVILWAAGCAAGAVALALLYSLIQMRAYASLVPEAERLPIFPGAQSVRVGYLDDTHSLSPNLRLISFATEDPFENVAAYYRKELPTRGWRESSEHDSFNRVDQGSAKQWTLRLEPSGGGENPPRSPGISIHVQALPDVRQLPLYPGAQQFQDRDSQRQDGTTERTVSFTTAAAPAEVQSFYGSRLESNGWTRLAPSESPNRSDYTYYLGSTNGRRDTQPIGWVTITTTHRPGGSTFVQIRALGPDL